MYRKSFIALLAGGALPLAFAPFNFYPLAFLAPALLIYCWLHAKPSNSFIYGLCYGIGFFGIGVSWVYISMHRFGELPVPIACFFTALFVLVLALFPALQGYCLKRFFPRLTHSKLLLALPISFALCDWLRSWLFTGFPWILLGYSQINSPLKGFAPIVGEYGLGFIITLLSALIVLGWHNSQVKASLTQRMWPFWGILLLGLIGFGLSKIPWTISNGKSMQVSLVQGNIPQQLKWQADFIQPTLERYVHLTSQHWQSDLIIWPEAAIPVAYQDASQFLDDLAQQAQQHKTRILLGIPEANGDEHFYNAVYVIGQDSGHYFKRQLVPFGEYLPFYQQLQFLFNYWQIPLSTLLPGPLSQGLLTIKGFKIAPFICYEIAYAKLVERITANTDFLITLSNDAWFGESFAPAQHLQIAQFRALTTQRYTLTSTNDGLTTLIDDKGQIVKMLPPFTTSVLNVEVLARNGNTPIMLIKSNSIITIFGLLLALAYWLRKRYPLCYKQDDKSLPLARGKLG